MCPSLRTAPAKALECMLHVCYLDEHCVYDPLSQSRQCHGCVHVVMYKLPIPSLQHLQACCVHRLCLNIFLLLIFRNRTCSGIPSRDAKHQTSSTICCIFYGLGQMVMGNRAGLDRSEPDSSTCGAALLRCTCRASFDNEK